MNNSYTNEAIWCLLMTNKKLVPSQITSTIEDYLEAILVLSETKGFAQVTEIANNLSISKASVTEMLAKLKTMGFVKYEKYGTITLTETGSEIAEKVKIKHDLLNAFLLLIGVSEENANADCCVMEHNLSKETVEKLTIFYQFLLKEKQADILERFTKYSATKN